jgi:hypothetical protein
LPPAISLATAAAEVSRGTQTLRVRLAGRDPHVEDERGSYRVGQSPESPAIGDLDGDRRGVGDDEVGTATAHRVGAPTRSPRAAGRSTT